jgi:hypothetical protein
MRNSTASPPPVNGGVRGGQGSGSAMGRSATGAGPPDRRPVMVHRSAAVRGVAQIGAMSASRAMLLPIPRQTRRIPVFSRCRTNTTPTSRTRHQTLSSGFVPILRRNRLRDLARTPDTNPTVADHLQSFPDISYVLRFCSRPGELMPAKEHALPTS